MEIIQGMYERLQKYPYLCNLKLERVIEGEECQDYNLILEFCDFPNYVMEDKLTLKFNGVRNLNVKNLDGMLAPVLVIRDLKDRQLENIHYYVEDGEEEMFSFYCFSFEVK